MFKRIANNAVKVCIIVLAGYWLVCMYKEKIYYKPEAVANRIEKASQNEYEAKLAEANELNGSSKTIVVIDAYGGGNDQGLKADNILEKEVTLGIAKATRDALKKEGIEVFLTRDEDLGLSDRQRINIRDAVEADYYIRLIVSEGEKEAMGVRVAYSSTYYNKDVTNADFAALLERCICDRAQTEACGIIDRCGEDQWLEGIQKNCAIVSVGYISHDKEGPALNNDAYQKKIAEGIKEAVIDLQNSITEKTE